MLKKVLVTVIAAGALAVPFAAVAGADPTSENPGLPGTFGGLPPGAGVTIVAHQGPGAVSDAIGVYGTPGSTFKQFTPGHTK
ncbi:hypothetical protein [Mycobacterium sp. URHB0044]|jgi:hypothetical protein|uniref:hypothetical protein n=1 Tax=Mycobacterium sp. URHB0044 TaxID=1380386 RepID=UPI00048B2453|nr:hypothetical protein [Mycobacterium sp. URHB0044]